MRTPTELVDALARELLPCPSGVLVLSDLDHRAIEFDLAAEAADPNGPQRAIAQACAAHLRSVDRSLRLTAFRT